MNYCFPSYAKLDKFLLLITFIVYLLASNYVLSSEDTCLVNRNNFNKAPLEIIKNQRSHNLFVFSNSINSQHDVFRKWFSDESLSLILNLDKVISAQHFQQHELDIFGTSPIGDRFLGIYELSLDGAEQAVQVIDRIKTIYNDSKVSSEPATWIYYPMSEKAGRSPQTKKQHIILAFSDPVKGAEASYNEWYNTQHIRHALNVSSIVSGQRFRLTSFQKPGAMKPSYEYLSYYEQEGSIEDLTNGFKSLQPGQLDLSPAIDMNFTEWVYFPVTDRPLLMN